jgi:UDP-N-acetylmuramyl-tripeptide synthetase
MALLHLPLAESAAQWLRERVRAGQLHTDSRRVKPGDAFIAWPGAATDGRQYVEAALQAGAVACLIEHEGAESFGFSDDRIASVTGLKAASGPIAAAYFGQPSGALEVMAVTGTNGKTSTAWWMAQLLNILRGSSSLSKDEHSMQYPCALIGTLGIGTPGKMVSTGLTTPDPVMLQAEFARLREAGATAVAIEASSIGIAEYRLHATAIRTAIFTNFTQDHLDYHGSMDAYWQAKRALFGWPGLKSAVINIDDERGESLARELAAQGLKVWTVSLLRTDAPTGHALWASPPTYDDGLMHSQISEGSVRVPISVPVLGDYNLANLLGVMAAACDLGYSLQAIAQALTAITAVPGRMEHVKPEDEMGDGPQVIVDYAHTPDALTQVLRALKPVALSRGGKLWCVFGCGGDRDPIKRPLMANAVEQEAHQLVITSDNPRSESPEAIIADIVQGLLKPQAAQVQVQRAQAIDQTIAWADTADVVLLAGKGHEDYQEIKGVKHPFSDIVCAREALARRAAVKPSQARSLA